MIEMEEEEGEEDDEDWDDDDWDDDEECEEDEEPAGSAENITEIFGDNPKDSHKGNS